MACGPEEWQLFMTDDEVAQWEVLDKQRIALVRQIAKIRKRCHNRRRRFNRSSENEVE